MNGYILFFSRSFLVLVLIGLLVPLYPLMPTAGLDPSWSFAMSYALKTDLTIGKDLIFTFGPYVYLYTKIYMPNTDWPSLILGGYLVFSYFFSLRIILSNKESVVKNTILVSIGLGFLVFCMDTVYLIYPILAILALLVYIEKISNIEINEILLVALLFTPFGILSLIKGSFFIVCFMFYILSAVYLWLNKKNLMLIGSIFIFPVSIIMAWLVSGEPIVGMYHYFSNLLPVISGYTSAMSVTGYIHDIILYLLASFTLVLGIYKTMNLPIVSKYFLLIAISGYLFLAFKAGLVRHDVHAIISANVLFLFCFFIYMIFKNQLKNKIFIKLSILISFLGLFLSVMIYSFIPNSSTAFIKGLSAKSIEKSQVKMMSIKNIADLIYANFSTFEIVSITAGSTYEKFNNYAPPLSALVGMYIRVFEPERLQYEYSQAIDKIKSYYNIPLLSGTSDIYSYGQSYLIASGNQWNPRPIFQGYSVYTKDLAEKNRQHLLGSNSPDNIFLKVETIDYRLPSMDDGASWPVLLKNYDLVNMQQDLLVLKKKILTPTWKENLIIKSENYQLGQTVTVPNQEQVVIAEFLIKQTFLGRLMNFLYKPDELVIVMELENGENKVFRFVPGETELGIILSPLIENTNEFSYFYGNRTKLAGKRVKSFSILEAHNRLHWERQYQVVFKSLLATDEANGQL